MILTDVERLFFHAKHAESVGDSGTDRGSLAFVSFCAERGKCFFSVIRAPVTGNRSLEEHHADADATPILLTSSVRRSTCQQLCAHSCHFSSDSVRLAVNALRIC